MPSAHARSVFEPVETSQCAEFARRNPLPVTQTSGLGFGQDKSRDVVQRSLDRKQISAIRCYMPTLRDRIQCYRLPFREAADRKAAQFNDVSQRPEARAEIARQGTDVSSLADERLVIGVVPIEDRGEPQLGNFDRPCGWRGRFPGPGELISASPIDLECRISRRPLQNGAGKGGEDRLDRLAARPRRGFAGDLALAVVGCTGDTPADAKTVALAAGHRISGSFGRLAEGDRQYARRERVEWARLPSLSPGSAANHLAAPFRGEPERLVDEEPAVDAATTRHRPLYSSTS